MNEPRKKIRPAGRYRYTENYRMHLRKNPDGTTRSEAEYIGKYLRAEHLPEVYHSFRLFARLAAPVLLCASLLLLTVQGFAVYQGGVYALVPAAMALFPEIYLLLGALKLPAEDRRLQEDIHHFAHERIRRSAIGILVLYGLVLLLTLLFLLTSRPALQIFDGVYCLLAVFPLFAAGRLLGKLKKLVYRQD